MTAPRMYEWELHLFHHRYGTDAVVIPAGKDIDDYIDIVRENDSEWTDFVMQFTAPVQHGWGQKLNSDSTQMVKYNRNWEDIARRTQTCPSCGESLESVGVYLDGGGDNPSRLICNGCGHDWQWMFDGWIKAEFTVEGMGKFEGWTDGDTWNGWEVPWFDINTIRKIAKVFTERNGFDEIVDFDELGQPFLAYEADDWEPRGLSTITMPDGPAAGQRLYHVDGWIWSLFDSDWAEYCEKFMENHPIEEEKPL